MLTNPAFQSDPPQRNHQRAGRLLVECLVAMLLLNATALVVVTLTRGVASASQRTTLVARAWAISVRDIERATGTPCAVAATFGGQVQPQVVSAWSERMVGPTREHTAALELTYSPLAGAAPSQLSTRAAWSCP